jgi:hypothetical protein
LFGEGGISRVDRVFQARRREHHWTHVVCAGEEGEKVKADRRERGKADQGPSLANSIEFPSYIGCYTARILGGSYVP